MVTEVHDVYEEVPGIPRRKECGEGSIYVWRSSPSNPTTIRVHLGKHDMHNRKYIHPPACQQVPLRTKQYSIMTC